MESAQFQAIDLTDELQSECRQPASRLHVSPEKLSLANQRLPKPV
jgi:hypothetical protein